jgi:hypothetical protein
MDQSRDLAATAADLAATAADLAATAADLPAAGGIWRGSATESGRGRI